MKEIYYEKLWSFMKERAEGLQDNDKATVATFTAANIGEMILMIMNELELKAWQEINGVKKTD